MTLLGVLEIPRLVGQEESEGSLGYGNVRFTFLGPQIKQMRIGSWLHGLGQVLNLLIQFSDNGHLLYLLFYRLGEVIYVEY